MVGIGPSFRPLRPTVSGTGTGGTVVRVWRPLNGSICQSSHLHRPWSHQPRFPSRMKRLEPATVQDPSRSACPKPTSCSTGPRSRSRWTHIVNSHQQVLPDSPIFPLQSQSSTPISLHVSCSSSSAPVKILHQTSQISHHFVILLLILYKDATSPWHLPLLFRNR